VYGSNRIDREIADCVPYPLRRTDQQIFSKEISLLCTISQDAAREQVSPSDACRSIVGCCRINKKYNQLSKRMKFQKVLLAITRKMLVIIFNVLNTGQPFDSQKKLQALMPD
jgi:hypothetical protein